MDAWFDVVRRWVLCRWDDRGQTEIVLAIVLFLLILMLAGRRVVVQ